MTQGLSITPQGWRGLTADVAMVPFMWMLLQIQGGYFDETPQRTLVWNNVKFNADELSLLRTEYMVRHIGRERVASVPGIIRQILWNRYYVLGPHEDHGQSWFVGWRYPDGSGGASRIPIVGPVRVMVSDGSTDFFGIDAGLSLQLPLRKIGCGQFGDLPFRRISLR